MYEIEIYKDKNGKSDIEDYFDRLRNSNSKESKIKSDKIAMYIDLLSKHGLQLGEPYIKKLSKEIWEIRPIRDRILFAGLYNNKFILLCHFLKQTQKTPRREIKKAKKLLDDYKRRSERL